MVINSGLWVIKMCHCTFTHCNNCTTLVGVVHNVGRDARESRGIWEISLPSAQFCWEPKTILKNNLKNNFNNTGNLFLKVSSWAKL